MYECIVKGIGFESFQRFSYFYAFTLSIFYCIALYVANNLELRNVVMNLVIKNNR